MFSAGEFWGGESGLVGEALEGLLIWGGGD